MDTTNFDWSMVAAFFSALAALGSLIISKSQFKYLKTKEASTLAFSSNFEEIVLNYDYDEKQFEEVVNNHWFELQNLSLLQINLVEVELEEVFTKNKKKFFHNVDDNPALLPLGFPMQPIIKNFQGYHLAKQKFSYIKPDEVIKIQLPSFILKEFIHAFFILQNGKTFSYTNTLKIKIRYYDKESSKIKELIRKKQYEIKFIGARAVVHFNFEPIVIRLG